MLVGIVGKPSSGKSTFFNAATLGSAKTGKYPFTTIEPNEGVSWVRVPCPHTEIGKACNPRTGFCRNGWRFVPVKLLDVAGLVPGAHEGRGLGNRFMNHLLRADVLIHVVDLSGTTDEEGNETSGHDPMEDVRFLEEEIVLWLAGHMDKILREVKKLPRSERVKRMAERLTGFGIGLSEARRFAEKEWEDPVEMAREFQRNYKPIVLAGNKVDLEEGRKNYERLSDVGFVPVSAISEYALRMADRRGVIRYVYGEGEWDEISPSEEEKRALDYIRERVIRYFGNTGVQQVINRAVLEVLGYKVVFPVENAEKWTDSRGNVLPDAVLLPKDGTLRDLAAKVHTELAEEIKGGIDARTGRRIGADYVLKNGDVVKIVV